ncbi:hypothetical protein CROQUDRAFT_470130 [Cronartium quercuum f. sp. fusiforme G11]|uniref:Uncharacterized protein n=1 Tax=Cronartium quercuum f. sp. fusiforme G11 TaxID=708437 RepID=A0A9P6NQ29_9BASI|nr:hypothetical protein CROQUDRAFT_470130 [Cronartium quercuum f. sp. fusiforme G11]
MASSLNLHHIPTTSQTSNQPFSSRITLDQLLDSATLDDDTLPSDLDLDLDDIYSRRNQSLRKFDSTLQSIYFKYEGDGDEEADDVVDLFRLEVIEDRGKIRSAFGNQLHHPTTSHSNAPGNPSSTKDPVAGPSRTVESTKLDLKVPSSDMLQSEIEEEDDEGDWVDDDLASVSSSTSVTSLQPTSKWHQESIPHPSPPIRAPKPPPARPPDPPLTSKPSSLLPYQNLDGRATNALFERLKKRVEERSTDLRQLEMQKKTRETSPGSETSSRVCPKDSSTASLCSSLTVTSDHITDTSSDASKTRSRPAATVLRSDTFSQHSLCSSPITPRFTKPHPTPACESSPSQLPLGPKLLFSNKRSRLEFESSSLPRRRQPTSSRLKHELGAWDLNTSTPKPKTSNAGPSRLPRRQIVHRPTLRQGTRINPRPIPRRRCSRESSEDPLCLPPTPSRRAAEKLKAESNTTPAPHSTVLPSSTTTTSSSSATTELPSSVTAVSRFSASTSSRPIVIEISSSEDEEEEVIEKVKSRLDDFAFSSSPCRKRPRTISRR